MPMITKNDYSFSWSIPLVTNNNFHVMFNDGADWEKMNIRLKDSWKKTDKGVLLRFIIGKKTEVFETILLRGSHEVRRHQTKTLTMPNTIDYSTLKMGEGSYDNITKTYDLHIAKDVGSTGMMVTPIGCVTNCPDPSKECLVDKNVKKWSDVNTWPNKKLPVAGEDVEVLCPQRILIDIKETPILGTLTINGELLFSDGLESTTLKANAIYIN